MSKPEPTAIPAATTYDEATAALRPATTNDHARELASRESEGVTVVLLWHPREDGVTLAVSDSRSGDQFELPAAGTASSRPPTPIRPHRLRERPSFVARPTL